jgi:methylenetetrahydrofolate--tRNA-(uracil-5-)-methyltransferase
LKSDDVDTASGLLKRELAILGSGLIGIARTCAIDSGAALAVDRERFSRRITRLIEGHPNITLVRSEFIYTPDHGYDALIIAAGPLASDSLVESIRGLVGGYLSFYDAVAPIISEDSIDYARAFYGSRYGQGTGRDYLNCALVKEEYEVFYQALISAACALSKDFERGDLFQACQPIEEVARTGKDTLRYGALKPVGIDDPRTGRWPYALVQLRAEDAHRQAYNLVGFQTNLIWGEQKRVFSLIPGLENADFLRYGVMHRNTFIAAPRLCAGDFSLRSHPDIWFAGQITGTEGYSEAICSGLFVALNVYARLSGHPPLQLPSTTVSGSLFRYATDPSTVDYQPMHVNYGIIEPLEKRVKGKRDRYAAYSKRAQNTLFDTVRLRDDLGSWTDVSDLVATKD